MPLLGAGLVSLPVIGHVCYKDGAPLHGSRLVPLLGASLVPLPVIGLARFMDCALLYGADLVPLLGARLVPQLGAGMVPTACYRAVCVYGLCTAV